MWLILWSKIVFCNNWTISLVWSKNVFSIESKLFFKICPFSNSLWKNFSLRVNMFFWDSNFLVLRYKFFVNRLKNYDEWTYSAPVIWSKLWWVDLQCASYMIKIIKIMMSGPTVRQCFKTPEKLSLVVCGSFCGAKLFSVLIVSFHCLEQKSHFHQIKSFPQDFLLNTFVEKNFSLRIS